MFGRLLRLSGRIALRSKLTGLCGWSRVIEGESNLHRVVVGRSERIISLEDVATVVVATGVLEDDRLVSVDIPDCGIFDECTRVLISEDVVEGANVLFEGVRRILSDPADTRGGVVVILHQLVACSIQPLDRILQRVGV